MNAVDAPYSVPLNDLRKEVVRMLSLSDAEREKIYGTYAWRLLIHAYITRTSEAK